MQHLWAKRSVTPIQQSELTAITKAKNLCRYILTVTEKSPKRFRFTLTGRMQNLALDVFEQAYRANDVYMAGPGRETARNRRLDLQHSALTSAKLLGYMALLAREQGAILPKGYAEGELGIEDVNRSLAAINGHLCHGHTWRLRDKIGRTAVFVRNREEEE